MSDDRKLYLGSSKATKGENPPHLYIRIPAKFKDRLGIEKGDNFVFLEELNSGKLVIRVIG